MNAIDYIMQWATAKGYAFDYGNPADVNRWMGETDYSMSTDGTAVYTYLMTASGYDGSRDTWDVGVYFSSLLPFDFDGSTALAATEALKARAKVLLTDIAAGNELMWGGARFTYGYDDFAENVVWCCLRVTLTALESDCVEMPAPEEEEA